MTDDDKRGIWMETEEQGFRAGKPQRSDLRKVTIVHRRVSAWLWRQLCDRWYSPLLFAAVVCALASVLFIILSLAIRDGTVKW